MHRSPRSFLSSFILLATASWTIASGEEAKVDFAKDIQPILEFNCVTCHNSEKTKGGLRFDLRAEFLKGGEGGASLVAGKPDESLLMELVTLPADDSDLMPPEGGPLHE